MSKQKAPRRVADNEALAVGTTIRGSAQKLNLAEKMFLAKDDKDVYTMENLHQDTMKEALSLLVGFENVELNGVPVTMENAKDFLNLVFPRHEKDLENGGLKVVNKSFAIQVIERAAELEKSLGNV